ELLIPVNAVYEFVYPTVVGPRYSNMNAAEAPAGEQWIANPYLHEGEKLPYAFDIRVNLSAGLPIADISCETHKTDIAYEGRTFASVGLDESEHAGGNRDFICRYRLAGKAIDTGLLLYEGAEENFFLMMVQPPEKIRSEQIPPREYIFVVDVSGSMHGFPLDVSKELLRDLIGSLRPTDRFNVLLFSGGSTVLSEESMPATKKNIEYALSAIDNERGGGGTELLPALKKAIALPGAQGYSRSIVIATDGYVSVEKEVFDLIRNNLGTAKVFAFGIGSSVNRFLMEGMARAGAGEPFFVTSKEEALPVAKRFRELLASPVLTDIRVRFAGFQAYDVEPVSIPDVFADRPVIVYGKWRGERKGTIHVEGLAGNRRFNRDMNVSLSVPHEENAALRYLWARNRIAVLSDYNMVGSDEEIVCEITSLGLIYNLLTDYTSFVAADTMVRLVDGKAVTVAQPLPLPQGVSDYAVGAGRSFSRMSAQASPMLKVFKDKALCEETENEVKVEHDAVGFPVKVTPAHSIHIELKDITVPEGLNRNTVIKIMEGSLSLMEQCVTGENLKEMQIAFILVIDSGGRVKDVKADIQPQAHEQLVECIMNRCRGMYFQSSKNNKDVVITAVFSLG
ncbi:MAG: VWA domain-containing protein, partial [Deltaproteobacteria bacterium]|nr:VWA domain-containing protein [Deltaproteobacteria bacterium]